MRPMELEGYLIVVVVDDFNKCLRWERRLEMAMENGRFFDLRRCGVEQIDISDDCTVCNCDRFWSHRATGGERGSQGALIVCQEVTG